MKSHIYIIIISFLSILFSCKKEIRPNLGNGQKLLVVRGDLLNELDTFKIFLSYSQDFFDPQKPEPIQNAQVYIVENPGITDTLIYNPSGFFMSKVKRICKLGSTYTLIVKLNGQTYTATESLRPMMPIDSMIYKYKPKNLFSPAGYYVTLFAKEQVGRGDCYQWQIYRNDTLLTKDFFFIQDDQFINDGEPLSGELFFKFDAEDTVMVEQYSISREKYNFLTELQNQTGRNGSPFDSPPGNPTTNIRGGFALGFFSVNFIDRKSIIIKP